MNFSLLSGHAQAECEVWVKYMVELFRDEDGVIIGPRTHHFLRETWANGYLAGKQNEESFLCGPEDEDDEED